MDLTILQIVFNFTEFLHDLFGTYDLATVLFGAICAGGGIALSALVPEAIDAKIPPMFKSIIIADKKKRIAVGGIVSIFCLRIWGNDIAVSNTTSFIIFSLGIGLLNYHLLSVLINIATGAISAVAAKMIKQNQNSQTPDAPTETILPPNNNKP